MKKIRSFLLITTLAFSFFLILAPVQGRLDGLTVGDTLIYKVSDWDFPIEALFVTEGEDQPFDPNDFILDFSGSTLAFKIMEKGTDGYYSANAYAILAKAVQIPIPDYPDNPEDDMLSDIFGETITIPKGVGIGIGATLTMSDLQEMIDDTDPGNFYYYGGFILYLDSGEWDKYEEYFTGLTRNDTDSSGYDSFKADVIRTSSTFTVEITSEYYYSSDDPEYGHTSHSISVTRSSWHISGSNAGLLKEQSQSMEYQVTYTGTYYTENDYSDVDYTLGLGITYDSRANKPLPVEIVSQQDITLKVESASANYTATGFFDDEYFKQGLDYIIGNLTAAVGKDFVEYDVVDVQGCYYETDIYNYDAATQNLVKQEGSVWWNGFTGNPTFPESYSLSPLTYWYGSSIAMVPYSPGITPDYDMWRATANSIEAGMQIITTAVTSTTGQTEINKQGVTVNSIDLHSELRALGNYKYIYFYGDIDFSYDSNDVDVENRDSSWIADQVFNFNLELNVWSSYSLTGLLAGYGLNTNFTVDLTNWMVGETWDGSSYVPTLDDGAFSFAIDAKLQNKQISDLPDASEAKKDTGGDGGLIPSFELLTGLAVMAIASVIIRRKRE